MPYVPVLMWKVSSIVLVLVMVETGKEEQKGEKEGDRKGGRAVWQVALTKAERNDCATFTSKMLLDS